MSVLERVDYSPDDVTVAICLAKGQPQVSRSRDSNQSHNSRRALHSFLRFFSFDILFNFFFHFNFSFFSPWPSFQ